ncbi:demethoxyubiquinone hydroxylase family protein [Phyllobacterium sp. 628]|uniref:demethoxyubiquinone hydroxylase family protein n=1 Tax=Phyllobacterium sp. 628 TaxID=2718938 RepID=UPI0016621D7A|nr:demethoxyubiquinone hydroxylase family protein [Phyllobacterium sp. 628]QND51846.1 demethoxyubiquinone hydroxylase family protein [Phyllobacterium sp. 628]
MDLYHAEPISVRDRLTIGRIARVNHAGEFGAIRIYSAQILVSKWCWPDCVPALTEMLEDERNHCRIFRVAMLSRKSRPCRAMYLWSYGGWLLGFLTALLGRQGIWACTAAVEAVVHRHLDDQIHFLKSRDPELYGIIQSIRDEELAHLQHAEERLISRGIILKSLRGIISLATGCLIWLSTWGDSARMARALKANN